MKKIFVVLNGANTENTILFACYIAGFTKSRLTGIFPAELPYAKEPALKQVFGQVYVESIVESDVTLEESYRNEIARQQSLFENICENKGIPYRVFPDAHVNVEELIAESRLADLIIIDTAPDSRYENEEERNKLTRLLLSDAECPVLIAPAVFEPIDEVIFCYDGSASAVFAMKQLTYLLPGLEDLRVTALQVGEVNEVKAAENSRLRDWLKGNYRYTDIVTIKGTPDKELFNYLLKKKRTLVVLGAYGRGMISRFFHQSKADLIINSLPFPIFITHY
jgi:hypothetical protein